MVDIAFAVDIVLGFMTSVITKKGNLSVDSSEIYADYTSQTRFYIDSLSLLSTRMFTYFMPSFKYFGYCKLLRVLRLNTMIARSNMNVSWKAMANLVRILLYLILYIHTLGCYWWQVSNIKSPREFVKINNPYYHNGI